MDLKKRFYFENERFNNMLFIYHYNILKSLNTLLRNKNNAFCLSLWIYLQARVGGEKRRQVDLSIK